MGGRALTDAKAELVKQRKHRRGAAGSRHPDELAGLNAEYLKDPNTLALKDYKDRKRHLNWWSSRFGAAKVLGFGVLEQRAARDALIPGRANATVNRHLAAQKRAWNWDGR